jgi:carboxylesterase
MFTVRPFQGEEHQGFYWNGGQPAALLVHGFPGTPAEMRPLASALQAAGWTSKAILLPGFGAEIETINEQRAEDWQRAVNHGFADLRRQHQPVVLIGYSLGGALALVAAAQQPPDALVLLAPFSRIDHILWPLLPALKPIFRGVRPFRLLKLDFNNPEVRAGIHNFMPDADLDDPQVQQAIRDMRLPLELFAQIRRAGLLARRAASALPADLPVLIIQGSADDLVRPRQTSALVSRIKGRVNMVEVPARHDLLVTSAPAWPQIEHTITDFCHTLAKRTE